MENNKITGNEPAYPIVDENQGLTIRQQFAMAAMQSQVALLANENFRNGVDLLAKNSGKVSEEIIAELSVKQADALIAELNK